ncbi:MAG: M48 family metallopeptidase [Alcanivoracaceae bacterium]|jgi:predicted Zn-dependent protease|nr:M48 family metallopeptidase [Alcanivoracaceae bacterium]
MTVQIVEGHAFHADLPKGRASGTITIDHLGIRFERDGKGVTLPIRGTVASLGGASDRLVFFAHPDYPGWQLYTSDRAVLNNPLLQRDAAVGKQLRGARVRRWFNWSVFIGVTAAIILLPLSLLFSMDTLTGIIAPKLPASWEENIGESAFAQYRINADLIESDEIDKALAALTDPLVNAVGSDRYQFRIHIIQDPELNAFALPGGYIALNSGLILRAESASEVLGVLAHEIAHVTRQHGVRQIMGHAGILLTVQALVGDVSGIMATVAAATPLLLSQSYSRGFESEADEYGFRYLSQAQLDPNGLVSFFEKILEEEKKRLEKIEDEDTRTLMTSAGALLSSHPATEKRIEKMQELARDAGAGSLSLEAEFLALQALVRQAVADSESSEDQTETDNE